MRQALDVEQRVSAFPIQFDIVGCFPTTGTLFLSPTISTPLRTIHGQMYDTLRQLGIEVGTYYVPESWNPHCTIGLNLSGTTMTKAFERALHSFTVLSGSVIEVGAIEVAYIDKRHAKSQQVALQKLQK